MSEKELEAMARLLNVAASYARQAKAQGFKTIHNALLTDIKILANYGAIHTAMPQDDFVLAQNGINVMRNTKGEIV